MLNLPDIHGAPVAVDTETTGLYPDQGARITHVSVATEGFEDVWDVRKESMADYVQLLGWLSRQKLIYQNAKFDMTMFLRGAPNNHGYNLESRFYWDTKEATGLLWPVGPWKLNEKNHKKEYTTSLKPVSEWLWGLEATAAERKLKEFLQSQPKNLQKRYDLVPDEILRPYALQDARLTYRLWKEQTGFQREYPHVNNWTQLLVRELEFEKVLYRMETRGIGFNVDRAREISNSLQKRLEEMERQLPVRPTRQQMVKYWWLADEGAPDWIPRTEKTEAVQLDEYVLWKLTKLNYPFAQLYYDYEQIKSAQTKWYNKWPDKVGADGRLRVDYQQNGAMTTRLSGREITLQGVPQDWKLSKEVPSIRKLFIPKPGHELWVIDLQQAEIRIATAIAGCKLARQFLENGMDFHAETAKIIFKRNGDWTKEPYKELRYIAKTTNLAMLYTAGADRLTEQITHEGKIDYTKTEALKIMAAHRQLYPEYYYATDLVAAKMKERGWIKLISGRKIYFQPWEHRFYKSFNNLIQGNTAQFVMDWMIWIEHNYPGILLLQTHDDVTLELPVGSRDVVEKIRLWAEERASDIFHIKMIAKAEQWN